MEDYIPFMDLHPELKLIPTTSVQVNIGGFKNKFDYVQDFNRNGGKEKFHLLVKDFKFGLMLHSSGFFSNTDYIALPAVYESIDFLYKREKSFGAIVKQSGKYGLFFWKYGAIRNEKFAVPIEYDSMVALDNKRIKAIKNDKVVYFDETGHVLK